MTHALLLIAHGSRRPQANADLARLADLIREQPESNGTIVEIGYLELTGPTIPEGFRKCVALGATRVRIVPYFLSMGVHMQEDLTEICQQLKGEFPEVRIQVRRPLGLHPKVVDVVMERCGLLPADQRDRLSDDGPTPPDSSVADTRAAAASSESD